MSEEIFRLKASGVLKEVAAKPTIVNALSVAINANGKKRLVLDLRTVNPRLNVSHYTYEDIQIAS